MSVRRQYGRRPIYLSRDRRHIVQRSWQLPSLVLTDVCSGTNLAEAPLT